MHILYTNAWKEKAPTQLPKGITIFGKAGARIFVYVDTWHLTDRREDLPSDGAAALSDAPTVSKAALAQPVEIHTGRRRVNTGTLQEEAFEF